VAYQFESDGDEAVNFCSQWGDVLPLVSAPETPKESSAEAKDSFVTICRIFVWSDPFGKVDQRENFPDQLVIT